MRVVIAGGHGKIAMLLGRRLAERGDEVIGLIRNPDHEADLRTAGVVPRLCDLETASPEQVAPALRDAQAVVYAAGAGPGSGLARKRTMDLGGAVLVADAAERAGVPRYLLISAMGLHRVDQLPPDDVFGGYLRAKAESEADLGRRDLEWVILRPGRLTDEPGTGRVRLAAPELPRGAVPREDVAAVLQALLDEPRSAGHTLELVAGDTPVGDAVAAALA